MSNKFKVNRGVNRLASWYDGNGDKKDLTSRMCSFASCVKKLPFVTLIIMSEEQNKSITG